MSETISIEIKTDEFGGTTFNVSQGERLADGLQFEEMLGVIAAITMPKSRPCVHWMRTASEREAFRAMLDSMQRRIEAPSPDESGVAVSE